MPSVLFVCTANRFRSPLAAALFKQALQTNEIPGTWNIESAGTWASPGQSALPSVIETAQHYGLDLSTHRSSRVSGPLLSKFDLILVMEASHKEALQSEFPALNEHIYLLSKVVEHRTFDIPDSIDTVQGVMDVSAELDDLIRRGLHSIGVLATFLHNQGLRS